MNIFILKRDPVKAAQLLDDTRLGKMLLEDTQLIATALIDGGAPESVLPKTLAGTPYRKTHSNHPCALWVRETQANFTWTLIHAHAAGAEFLTRFGKVHASHQALIDMPTDILQYIPKGELTPWPLCMPDEFKTDDPVESYRAYYRSKPSVVYKRTATPNWMVAA